MTFEAEPALRYSGLRYVDASRIQGPTGTRAGLDLRGVDDTKLGSLDGVLIDSSDHTLRFYVVESPTQFGTRRRLLSTDLPAQVSHGGTALRMALDAEDLAACEEFESSEVRPYSDDDLVGAMLTQRIA
jgi:hypothetical protein